MENWKPIPGWETLYEASDLGRIRSIKRLGETLFGKRFYGGGVLNPICPRNEYLCVNFTDKGKRYQMPIHRAVLMAFVGLPPVGHEACHNDGNKKNNRLENLRWDTRSANHQDQLKHGTRPIGEQKRLAKATEEAVKYIRSSNEMNKDLAKMFNISTTAVYCIKSGKTWTHVK